MRICLQRNKLTFLSAAQIGARLKMAGVQPTSQRISICRYVLFEADHPTAEDVYRWAEKNLPKISLATVYNSLKILVSAKILREFKFPHSDKVIYDDNIEDHFHFLDEKSGKLFDVHHGEIELSMKLSQKFKIKGFDLLLKGEIKGEMKSTKKSEGGLK